MFLWRHYETIGVDEPAAIGGGEFPPSSGAIVDVEAQQRAAREIADVESPGHAGFAVPDGRPFRRPLKPVILYRA